MSGSLSFWHEIDSAARRSEVILSGVAVEAKQMAGQTAPRLAKRIVVVHNGLPVDALAAREDMGEFGIVAHAGGLTAAGGRAALRRFPPRCGGCAGRAVLPKTRGRERRWCSRRRSARRPTTASASTPFSADFIVGTKHSNFFQKLGNEGMRCMLFRREMQEKANFAKK